MAIGYRKELGLIVAWLLFPLVPVVLEDAYYSTSNLNLVGNAPSGPDPHEWGWFLWLIMLGPLLGYGFLAGATLNVPDETEVARRRFRRVFRRRALWVAIGPWWGALVCAALFLGLAFLEKFLGTSWLRQIPAAPPPRSWLAEWAYWFVGWILSIIVVAIWAYSWIWPAQIALRRASRIGQWKRALLRGVILAGAFVGSLFGSFWAATAVWRSYFFDSRVVPLLLLGAGLVLMCGCASTITYGELRRRELFHAMLMAWVLGLALMWRWWSRKRPGHA